jgi:glycosyltransferase involved in cell wall biosynthesis
VADEDPAGDRSGGDESASVTGPEGNGEGDPDSDLTVHFLPDYTPTNPYQDRLAEALRGRGVTVRILGGGGAGLPILRAVWGREIPDVVHVHFLHQYVTSSVTRFPRLVAVLLSVRTLFEVAVLRVLGASVVWTAHDLLNHEQQAPFVETACKHLFLRFLVDNVIVHCESAADSVVEFYHLPDRLRERMTVVRHGTFAADYPNDITRETARLRLGVPEEAFVFTYFGSIRRYKNVTELIETFVALEENFATDTHLLIAGNPRTDALEREVTAAAANHDRIHTALEFVPSDEVQVYMNAADAVVLPFRADEASMLTSGSVLLAMSFGRPVVAPDIGCIDAYVTDIGGLVYDPTAPNGLGRTMQAAVDADTDRIGARNRKRAAALSWDDVADATHDVYVRIGRRD